MNTLGKLVYFDDDSSLAFGIDYDRFVFDRWQYTFIVATWNGAHYVPIIRTSELKSGCTRSDNPDRLGEMLATGINFFSAYVEAVEHKESGRYDTPENITLFDGYQAEEAIMTPYDLACMVSSDHISLIADSIKADA